MLWLGKVLPKNTTFFPLNDVYIFFLNNKLSGAASKCSSEKREENAYRSQGKFPREQGLSWNFKKGGRQMRGGTDVNSMR